MDLKLLSWSIKNNICGTKFKLKLNFTQVRYLVMLSLSVEQFANIGILKINYIGFLMLLSMKIAREFAEGIVQKILVPSDVWQSAS